MAEMEPVQGTEPDTNEEEEENEDDDDIYEVEKIVGMSVSPQGSRLYKVRWAGYSPSWDTWEPQDNLLSCLDMIEDYTKQEEEKRRTREEEKRLKREQEGAGHSKRRKMHYDEEKSDGDVDTVKDTFWRDLEEGKINVFQTGDLYSKVKSQGRAARPTSFTPLFTSPRKGNSQEEERPPKQKGKRGRKPKTSKEVKISKTSDKVQQMTALKDFVLISDDEEDNVMINLKINEPHSDLTKKDHKEVDEMELKPKQESSSGIISLVNKKMKDKTKKKREEIKGHTTKANDGKQTKKIKKEKLQSVADMPIKTDPDCPKITKINDKSKAQSTSEDVKNEMSELTMVFTKSEKGIATEKDVNEVEKKKEKLTEEAEKVPKKKRIKLDEDPGIKITITSSDPVTTNGEFMEDSQLTTTITTTTSTNQTLDTNSSSSSRDNTDSVVCSVSPNVARASSPLDMSGSGKTPVIAPLVSGSNETGSKVSLPRGDIKLDFSKCRVLLKPVSLKANALISKQGGYSVSKLVSDTSAEKVGGESTEGQEKTCGSAVELTPSNDRELFSNLAKVTKAVKEDDSDSDDSGAGAVRVAKPTLVKLTPGNYGSREINRRFLKKERSAFSSLHQDFSHKEKLPSAATRTFKEKPDLPVKSKFGTESMYCSTEGNTNPILLKPADNLSDMPILGESDTIFINKKCEESSENNKNKSVETRDSTSSAVACELREGVIEADVQESEEMNQLGTVPTVEVESVPDSKENLFESGMFCASIEGSPLGDRYIKDVPKLEVGSNVQQQTHRSQQLDVYGTACRKEQLEPFGNITSAELQLSSADTKLVPVDVEKREAGVANISPPPILEPVGNVQQTQSDLEEKPSQAMEEADLKAVMSQTTLNVESITSYAGPKVEGQTLKPGDQADEAQSVIETVESSCTEAITSPPKPHFPGSGKELDSKAIPQDTLPKEIDTAIPTDIAGVALSANSVICMNTVESTAKTQSTTSKTETNQASQHVQPLSEMAEKQSENRVDSNEIMTETPKNSLSSKQKKEPISTGAFKATHREAVAVCHEPDEQEIQPISDALSANSIIGVNTVESTAKTQSTTSKTETNQASQYVQPLSEMAEKQLDNRVDSKEIMTETTEKTQSTTSKTETNQASQHVQPLSEMAEKQSDNRVDSKEIMTETTEKTQSTTSKTETNQASQHVQPLSEMAEKQSDNRVDSKEIMTETTEKTQSTTSKTETNQASQHVQPLSEMAEKQSDNRVDSKEIMTETPKSSLSSVQKKEPISTGAFKATHRELVAVCHEPDEQEIQPISDALSANSIIGVNTVESTAKTQSTTSKTETNQASQYVQPLAEMAEKQTDKRVNSKVRMTETLKNSLSSVHKKEPISTGAFKATHRESVAVYHEPDEQEIQPISDALSANSVIGVNTVESTAKTQSTTSKTETNEASQHVQPFAEMAEKQSDNRVDSKERKAEMPKSSLSNVQKREPISTGAFKATHMELVAVYHEPDEQDIQPISDALSANSIIGVNTFESTAKTQSTTSKTETNEASQHVQPFAEMAEKQSDNRVDSKERKTETPKSSLSSLQKKEPISTGAFKVTHMETVAVHHEPDEQEIQPISDPVNVIDVRMEDPCVLEMKDSQNALPSTEPTVTGFEETVPDGQKKSDEHSHGTDTLQLKTAMATEKEISETPPLVKDTEPTTEDTQLSSDDIKFFPVDIKPHVAIESTGSESKLTEIDLKQTVTSVDPSELSKSKLATNSTLADILHESEESPNDNLPVSVKDLNQRELNLEPDLSILKNPDQIKDDEDLLGKYHSEVAVLSSEQPVEAPVTEKGDQFDAEELIHDTDRVEVTQTEASDFGVEHTTMETPKHSEPVPVNIIETTAHVESTEVEASRDEETDVKQTKKLSEDENLELHTAHTVELGPTEMELDVRAIVAETEGVEESNTMADDTTVNTNNVLLSVTEEETQSFTTAKVTQLMSFMGPSEVTVDNTQNSTSDLESEIMVFASNEQQVIAVGKPTGVDNVLPSGSTCNNTPCLEPTAVPGIEMDTDVVHVPVVVETQPVDAVETLVDETSTDAQFIAADENPQATDVPNVPTKDEPVASENKNMLENEQCSSLVKACCVVSIEHNKTSSNYKSGDVKPSGEENAAVEKPEVKPVVDLHGAEDTAMIPPAHSQQTQSAIESTVGDIVKTTYDVARAVSDEILASEKNNEPKGGLIPSVKKEELTLSITSGCIQDVPECKRNVSGVLQEPGKDYVKKANSRKLLTDFETNTAKNKEKMSKMASLVLPDRTYAQHDMLKTEKPDIPGANIKQLEDAGIQSGKRAHCAIPGECLEVEKGSQVATHLRKEDKEVSQQHETASERTHSIRKKPTIKLSLLKDTLKRREVQSSIVKLEAGEISATDIKKESKTKHVKMPDDKITAVSDTKEKASENMVETQQKKIGLQQRGDGKQQSNTNVIESTSKHSEALRHVTVPEKNELVKQNSRTLSHEHEGSQIPVVIQKSPRPTPPSPVLLEGNKISVQISQRQESPFKKQKSVDESREVKPLPRNVEKFKLEESISPLIKKAPMQPLKHVPSVSPSLSQSKSGQKISPKQDTQQVFVDKSKIGEMLHCIRKDMEKREKNYPVTDYRAIFTQQECQKDSREETPPESPKEYVENPFHDVDMRPPPIISASQREEILIHEVSRRELVDPIRLPLQPDQNVQNFPPTDNNYQHPIRFHPPNHEGPSAFHTDFPRQSLAESTQHYHQPSIPKNNSSAFFQAPFPPSGPVAHEKSSEVADPPFQPTSSNMAPAFQHHGNQMTEQDQLDDFEDEIILEEFTEERWNEMGAELLEAIEISNSDLKHAVKEGMYERVRKALNSQKQYNLEQPDQMGMTLVMLAAAKGFDDLVELLVINGANMNAKAKTGNTPLMFAAENGHLCTVAVLLALGAHINIQNGSQETALIKATKKGHNQIVKMLLENGADFSAENATGNTALKYAKLLNSVELQATINQHVKKLTALFTQQVYLTMNNTAETVCSLFPLHVLPLNEGDKFVIHFNHELQPTVPGVGMLLFVAHARITPQETKCRLSGPCAVKTAILNGVAQPTLTDEGQFVLSFSPLHNGRNELIIHTVYAPASRAKLVVGAYKAKLLPNSEQ